MVNRSPLKKLSEIINTIPETNKKSVIRQYDEYVRLTLSDRPNLSFYEKEIAEDYLKYLQDKSRESDQTSEQKIENKNIQYSETRELEDKMNLPEQSKNSDCPSPNISMVQLEQLFNLMKITQDSRGAKVNLNELICKPDIFNGYSPKPRDWIDSYEEAFQANEWSEENAMKYFPTFLRGSALDWFKTLVRPKLSNETSWIDLRSWFTNHYLGKDELRARRREFNELSQGLREPSVNFIPRAFKMIKLLYPSASNEEAIEMITDKLRPSILEKLCNSDPDSIETLVQICSKIECIERKVEERTRKYTVQNKTVPMSVKPTTNTSNVNKEFNDRPKIKCYACLAIGDHIASNCKATIAVDGKPLRKRKTKTINMVSEIQSEIEMDTNNIIEENNNSDSDGINVIRENEVLQTLNDNIQVVEKVRYKSIETRVAPNTINMVRGTNERLIFAKLLCNNEPLTGLVDTGAYHTVVNELVAVKRGWLIDSHSIKLNGAGNNPLICVGKCAIDVELSVGKRAKTARINVAVVRDLGTDMIVGIELLTAFEILIDVSTRLISFRKRQNKDTGIRTREDLTIDPRCRTLINSSVNQKGVFLIIPTIKSGDLLVANSLNRGKDDQTTICLYNTTEKPISIKKNTQLATFEEIDLIHESNEINSILELDEMDDHISIGNDLSEAQINDIQLLINDHISAFSYKGRIGSINDARFEHKIELLANSKPFNEPLRRRPKIHIDETRKIVDQMMQQGVIEESSSPWSSSYILVKKKTGEYRLCIDFRKLNNLTKKLVYPLPNIDDCLDNIAGNVYYSLIDFNSGFWQIPMDESSKEMTAFKTEDGLFQFKKMPFGLANAPSSFQRMINATMAGLTGVNLQVFMDDVCIASPTWEKHLDMLRKVLKIVIASNLTLRPSKCLFGASRVVFLGHEISQFGIKQDPSKTKALINMPPPKNTAGVHRVLGMLGYYRKFIPNFASISEPLTQLLKKNTPFVWGNNQDIAFRKLIEGIASDVTLAKFNHNDPIMIKTDACKSGVAGMIFQKHSGEWKLISCCSRRLNDSEENYGITDLEALAVIYTITKFRCYLLGKHFKIITDHSALKVFNERSPNSARLKRWAILLSEYDFEIIYTKGELQKDIDCLSRAPVDTCDRYLDDRIFFITHPIDEKKWCNEYKDSISKKLFIMAKKVRKRLPSEKWCHLL